MQPHCPHCGDAIKAADINLTTTLAKCQVCNSVFSIAPLVETERRRGPSGEAPRPIVPASAPGLIRPLPTRKFNTQTTNDTLIIEWRWFGPRHPGAAIFGIGLCIFVPYWPMFLGSIILFYYALAGICNSTRITVTREFLLIQHFPMPALVNRRLLSPQIQQIYCRHRTAQQSDDQSNRSGGLYDLFAVLGDNSRVELLRDFNDPDEPRYLEQQIERHLDIPDRRVMGEYLG